MTTFPRFEQIARRRDGRMIRLETVIVDGRRITQETRHPLANLDDWPVAQPMDFKARRDPNTHAGFRTTPAS